MRWTGVAVILCAAACESPASLENRPCPCAAGFICCELTKLCVEKESACVLDVTPKEGRLRLGAKLELAASLPVTWSVVEPNGGSVDASGTYQAPLRPGMYHVLARTAGGASASISVIVGPSELKHFVGVRGGKGNVDGVGGDARFTNPWSITGDAEFLFVSDGPAWGDGYKQVLGDEGCFEKFCSGTYEWGDLKDPCFVQHCKQPDWRPMGVRRISRATDEVKWLVDDRFLRPLASDGTTLFAGTSAPIGVCYFSDCGFSVPRSARVVVRVDRENGAVAELAGVDVPGPAQDGVGVNARFEGIRGMVAEAGAIFVSDGAALRRIEGATGQVTTLHAGLPFVSLGAVALDGGSLYAVDNGSFTDTLPYRTIWKYELATGAIAKLSAEPPSKTSLGFRSFCFYEKEYWPNQAMGVIDNCVGPVFKAGCTFGSSEAGNADGAVSFKQFQDPQGIWCAGQIQSEPTFFVADTSNATVRKLVGSDGFNRHVETYSGAAADHDGTALPGPWMRLVKPVTITSDAEGSVIIGLSNGMGNPGKPNVVHVSSGMEFETYGELPYVEELAAGPKGTLYAASGFKLWQVNVQQQSSLLLVDWTPNASQNPPSGFRDLAHDGVDTLYASYRSSDECRILRTDATLLALGMLPVLVDGYCGPLAVDGPRQLFLAHGALEFDPALFPRPTYTELSRLDVTTGQVTVLPAPPDGWLATALAYDPIGVLYVAEAWSQRIRGLVVDSGEIFDVVGKLGHQGVQLGPLPASLNMPADITLSPDGSLAIADYNENVAVVAQ